MIPQTRAGTRTPAWPRGGARDLPGTGLAALSRPTAIAAHGMWPISTYALIYIDGARGLESEKKKTGPSDPDTAGLGFR